MGNIWGGELLVLMILIVIILGPTKLPEYAAKLRDLTIKARDFAKGASSNLRNEMGPAFDDVDWQQLDPRQYDPRRIVRDALAEPSADGSGSATQNASAGANGTSGSESKYPGRQRHRPIVASALDPSLPTPFDTDAT